MPHSKEIEDLRKKIQEADALAEMKSNFLATMSHEIRTPMQSIYGLLELIRDEQDAKKVQNMSKIAQKSAAGLLEILDDILDFAKMDADKMELDEFEVPLRMLVRGILEALSVKVHGVNIELIDDIEKNVPFVITGDPKRMRQIIMNLCGNAIKFTKEGSVTVRVSLNTKHLDTAPGRIGLRFEVIDTGIGMPKEVSDKLFQAFTQADNTTQRNYGGTGLGLSISKKLVDLMGGQIGVTSKEGIGSTFWFEIPAREVDVNASSVNLPNLDGISVLSVEDHPQGAKEIINSLQAMGAKVENCATYADGLEIVKHKPFDVGIIDQGLPDGLGLDLIKEIINIRPNMGLIMYTVREDSGLQHSLKSLGVTYLTKPASRRGLAEAVRDNTSRLSVHEFIGPKKLLIAEDTDSVRYTLQQQLNKLGVEADFAEDGEQAWEMLNTGEYGILLTDLHMPKMDGYKLIEKIRAEYPANLPAIVLTADVQMGQKQAYMKHSFDEALIKPVSIGHLRGLLTRWGILSFDDHEIDNTSKSTKKQKTKITSGAVDISAIEQQFGAFDDMAIEMLGMFADMTEPLIEKIRKAHIENDPKSLAEHAHSLKGAARSACCFILGDLAEEIQDNAEKGASTDHLLAKMDIAFEDVKEAIKAL